MIIPVRCFTCGKVLGSKWKKYQQLTHQYRFQRTCGTDSKSKDSVLDIVYLSSDEKEETPECKALNELKIIRYCCRRHMLGHVELVQSL